MTVALVRIGAPDFPSAHEETVEVLRRSKLGEALVRLESGGERWIPADWIVEITE